VKHDAKKGTTSVSDIMAAQPWTCVLGDSLNRAAQLMWDHRCGCVPIVDRAGALAGLLTDRDVAMSAYTQGRRLTDIPVEAAMSRPGVTCRPASTIEDAENLMMAHAVRRLVVIDDTGQLRGLVSLDDIARCGAAWEGRADIDLERTALTLGEISRRTTTTESDSPEQVTTDVKDLVRNSLAVLKTLRKEIHVDLNLAGTKMRDRWRRLEGRLRRERGHRCEEE
jgi:CBS domain-containing protein